jgi:alpha-1,2-mannosyltransferase
MVVPLNIVLYNVINTSDTKGPEIFGTEPLQYYINNLVLNFNLIAPLAYLGIVVIPLLSKLKRVNDTGLRAREIMVIIAGLPLWSFIFFQQPHKEERFLYPIYSLINVSAAFTIHYLVNSATALAELIGINTNFIKFIRKIGIYVVVFTISIFSILKTTSLAKNYNGFIEIYKHIPQPPSSDDDDYSQKIVCTGREWHHYPSSFFLPFNHRLQFTSSSFNGLLPGDFLESESIFNGVRNIPDGMNDMNIYDPSKITQLAECDYFVDIEEDVDSESNEVDFWKLANDKETLSDSLGQWELIHDVEVLDVKKSWGLLKLIWLPEPIRQLAGSKLGVVEYGRVGLFKRVA